MGNPVARISARFRGGLRTADDWAFRHRPSVGERSAIEVILRIADPGVVPTLADHPANIPSYFIVTLLSCPF